MAIKSCFVYLFPCLFMAWVVLSLFRVSGITKRTGASGRTLIAVLSAVVTLLPLRGLSVADYILTPVPGYSIGSLVFFAALLAKEIRGTSFLSASEILQFSLWNIGLSICLYVFSLGFAGPDLYAMGYAFSPLFAAIAVLTIFLLVTGSRMAYIFITYIAAFDIGALPSPNFFDYMTDGILFIASLVAVVYYIFVQRPFHKRNRPETEFGHSRREYR